MNSKALSRLQKSLSYRFNNPRILEEALTHKSFINESKNKDRKDNERLEFLGDAVLDLIIGHVLMDQFPDAPEGDLSKMKAKIVSEDTLAQIAQEIDLGSFLELGKGETLTQGKEKPSLLSNALEALIAAMYLDADFQTAREKVLSLFNHHLKVLEPGEISFDYKTALQEYSQKQYGCLPVYTLIEASGPDHEKRFKIETCIDGKSCGLGVGKSKKVAEQQSAKEALSVLQRERK